MCVSFSAKCSVVLFNCVRKPELSGYLSRLRLLENLPSAVRGTVEVANRGEMKVITKGIMKLKPTCYPDHPEITVNGVQVIPDLSTVLLSVNQIVDRGHTVMFTKKGVSVLKP